MTRSRSAVSRKNGKIRVVRTLPNRQSIRIRRSLPVRGPEPPHRALVRDGLPDQQPGHDRRTGSRTGPQAARQRASVRVLCTGSCRGQKDERAAGDNPTFAVVQLPVRTCVGVRNLPDQATPAPIQPAPARKGQQGELPLPLSDRQGHA